MIIRQHTSRSVCVAFVTMFVIFGHVFGAASSGGGGGDGSGSFFSGMGEAIKDTFFQQIHDAASRLELDKFVEYAQKFSDQVEQCTDVEEVPPMEIFTFVGSKLTDQVANYFSEALRNDEYKEKAGKKVRQKIAQWVQDHSGSQHCAEKVQRVKVLFEKYAQITKKIEKAVSFIEKAANKVQAFNEKMGELTESLNELDELLTGLIFFLIEAAIPCLAVPALREALVATLIIIVVTKGLIKITKKMVHWLEERTATPALIAEKIGHVCELIQKPLHCSYTVMTKCAQILNLFFGSPQYSPTLQQEMEDAGGGEPQPAEPQPRLEPGQLQGASLAFSHTQPQQ